MWFKQIQIYKLPKFLDTETQRLAKQLEPLAFTSCSLSMPYSAGWVSPIDEEGEALVRGLNGYVMLCMQVEEKILPAAVISQTLAEQVKQIEAQEERKMTQKEKASLKEELTLTLLPRAFSKQTRFYGYIDTRNRWLILGTAHKKGTELFLSLFKKTVTEDIHPMEIKKLSPIFTHWLKHEEYPSSFGIEKTCVLQDPSQAKRVIRCQQQNLFASSIQSLIKDGCEIVQLGLSWQDRVNFILTDKLLLKSIQFQEELVSEAKDMEAETQQQLFDADFLIMTETFSTLLAELLEPLLGAEKAKAEEKEAEAVTD